MAVQKGADMPEMPQQEVPVEQQRLGKIQQTAKTLVGKVWNYGGALFFAVFVLDTLYEIVAKGKGIGESLFMLVFFAVFWLITKGLAMFVVMRAMGWYYTAKDITKF